MNDTNGLYKKLTLLFPDNIAKLNKDNLPFHMMNDRIMIITKATILDAWRENIGGELDDYIEFKPPWEDIEKGANISRLEFFETKIKRNLHDHRYDQHDR